MGVFASRSTFRPNGLGLSLVRLEGVDTTAADGPVLLLGGVDLLDGTPVYDVKPYLPYAEAIPDAASGFAGEEIQRLAIQIAPQAAEDFAKLPARAQAVLRESLSLDPRPATRVEESEREYGASLCGCNVRFRVDGETCVIISLKESEGSGLNN